MMNPAIVPRSESPRRTPKPPVVAATDARFSGTDSTSTVTLWQQATAGDRRALELVISRMRPYLRRVWRVRLQQSARHLVETEDLLQESLIRAMKHLPQFQGQSIQDFRNWLHAVFRNLVIDEARKGLRVPVVVEPADDIVDHGRSPEEIAVDREHTAVFDSAVARLRPKERLLVIHRLQHGRSFQELSDMLGIASAAAGRMAFNRELRKLRDEMKRLMSGTTDSAGTIR